MKRLLDSHTSESFKQSQEVFTNTMDFNMLQLLIDKILVISYVACISISPAAPSSPSHIKSYISLVTPWSDEISCISWKLIPFNKMCLRKCNQIEMTITGTRKWILKQYERRLSDSHDFHCPLGRGILNEGIVKEQILQIMLSLPFLILYKLSILHFLVNSLVCRELKNSVRYKCDYLYKLKKYSSGI